MAKKDEIILSLLERVKKDETDSYNYVVPQIISQKLRDYTDIQSDLVFLIDAVSKLIVLKGSNQRDLTIETSIWYSIIVIYGKCFTDATLANRTKLEIRDCLPSDNTELKDLHNSIIGLRHNFIAHRGNSENDVSIAILKLPKVETPNSERTQYRIKSYKTQCPNNTELTLYRTLFQQIKNSVDQKIQKQANKTNKAFTNMLLTIPLLKKYTLIKE